MPGDSHDKVTVYHDAALAAYGFGEGHPFGPDRLDAFWEEARRQGLDHRVNDGVAAPATRSELGRFHSPTYLEKLATLSATGRGYLDAGDTPAFPGILEASLTVAGCVLDGMQRILAGRTRRVFVPIAGLHHAQRDSAAGFCAINDIGVLVESLRLAGIQRIAYIDIDAHHGDGVYYSYQDDPLLFIADIHEDGRYLYPGTGFADENGRGEAAGTKLNLPLTPPACRDADFFAAWERVETFVREARPEFVILQAGADSIAGDPITHMQLSTAAHEYATRALCRIADECCDGRLLATGGGGYNRHNLAQAWCKVVTAMVTAH